MSSYIDEEDFICLICQELPQNAHTSKCCGCVLCEKCTYLALNNSQKCPHCRNQIPEFEINVFLNKLLNKFPADCKYECGYTSQVSDIKSHEKECPKRNFTCAKCKFEGKKDEFLNHINDSHLDDVINQFDLFEDQNNLQMDPLQTIRNSNGDICHIGETSKFFCGKDAGHKCQCCDGQCGPHDGCNCVPCMELDLKYRNLKGRNVLINAAGRIALLKNESFYCGTLYEGYGTCGKLGYKCRYCSALTQDLSFYKQLLE